MDQKYVFLRFIAFPLLFAALLAGCSKPTTPNSLTNGANANTRPVTPNSNSNSTAQSSPAPDPEKANADYTNPIGMMFMKIGPGTFSMGAPENEVGRFKWDGSVHPVSIGYSFLMGKFEVTQEQYQKVTGTNPSEIDDCKVASCAVGPNNPVENVSWNDAKAFVEKLSRMDDKYNYRLPSESEWEFGCRAGTTTVFAFGDQLGSDQANFDGRSPYGSAPVGPYKERSVSVGSYRPNAWGLYDMHGNVSEWVEDYFHDDYRATPTDGKAMLKKGSLGGRVIRNGGYLVSGRFLRCSRREGGAADFSPVSGGFRIVAIAK